jgi:hypothetical protein
MISILNYSLILSLLVIAGCSEKKLDIPPANGRYFIETLGHNIDNKSPEKAVKIIGNYSNESYRYGSLSGKLSDNIVSSKVAGGFKEDIRVFAIPTISNHNITTLTSGGNIVRGIISPNGTFKKTWIKSMGNSFCSNIAIGERDNIIVATCGTNTVKGFDSTNGSELWSLTLDNPITSQPSFIGDYSILFGKNDSIYSVNYKSGELYFYIANTINSSNKSLFPATPLIVDDYIIQQSADDQVRAINSVNGQVEWMATIANQYSTTKGKEFLNSYGNIAYDKAESALYLNNSSGEIVKIKIGEDKPQWTRAAITAKPLWLTDSIVVAVNELGVVMALSKSDGSIIWSNNIIKKIIGKGQDNDLFGKKKPYNEISLMNPVIIDNKIMITTSNSKLVIISPENGRLLQVKDFRQDIFGQLFVHNDKIYVMTSNGRQIIQL